jgi:PP-loop superfamily ATP-utilizing enzyme
MLWCSPAVPSVQLWKPFSFIPFDLKTVIQLTRAQGLKGHHHPAKACLATMVNTGAAHCRSDVGYATTMTLLLD